MSRSSTFVLLKRGLVAGALLCAIAMWTGCAHRGPAGHGPQGRPHAAAIRGMIGEAFHGASTVIHSPLELPEAVKRQVQKHNMNLPFGPVGTAIGVGVGAIQGSFRAVSQAGTGAVEIAMSPFPPHRASKAKCGCGSKKPAGQCGCAGKTKAPGAPKAAAKCGCGSKAKAPAGHGAVKVPAGHSATHVAPIHPAPVHAAPAGHAPPQVPAGHPAIHQHPAHAAPPHADSAAPKAGCGCGSKAKAATTGVTSLPVLPPTAAATAAPACH